MLKEVSEEEKNSRFPTLLCVRCMHPSSNAGRQLLFVWGGQVWTTTSSRRRSSTCLDLRLWGMGSDPDVVDDVSQCQVFRVEMSFSPYIFWDSSSLFPSRTIKRNKINWKRGRKERRFFGRVKDKRTNVIFNWDSHIPTTTCLSHCALSSWRTWDTRRVVGFVFFLFLVFCRRMFYKLRV